MNVYRIRNSATAFVAAIVAAACSSSPAPIFGGTPDGGAVGPPTIKYKPSDYECVVGQPCTIQAPFVTGSPATYAIAPKIPAGMTFHAAFGTLDGIPLEPIVVTSFTVKATNALREAQATFTLRVHPPELSPTSVNYSQNQANYTVGRAIGPNNPTYIGGKPTSYSVYPPLPAGLVMDPLTGVISGIPNTVSAAGSFKVTAENTLGKSSVEITIAIDDIPPSNLSYAFPSATYTSGSSATPNTPTIIGGMVTSFTVNPELPGGLHLNVVTGVISGTPTIPLPTTNFTVTATNSGGTASTQLSLSVLDIAPRNLTYSLNPAVYARNKPITPNIPNFSGGIATSFTVSPAFPSGMTFDAKSGAISGTPTHESSPAEYIVTAINSGGSTSIILTIEVKEFAPTGLTYSVNPARYHVHTPIPPNQPTTTGAAPTQFAVNPPLPAGLSLSATSGIINGTPSVPVSKGTYIVTASTPGGEYSEFLELEVEDDPPNELTFLEPQAIYRRGTQVVPPNRPSNTGGVATSYKVAPALPAGLDLNPVTGEISGTPTVATPEVTYTVTASNGTGETKADITISVQELPPSELSYAYNPASYVAGSPILANTPSSTGGPVTSYSVEPELPTGLTLDASSGAISGIPIGVVPSATYTVSAANESGIVRGELVIEVQERIPGLYKNNVLLLDKAVSTTYEQPLFFPEGAHTLEVAGAGDYTVSGSISGPGVVSISAGEGNTIFLTGPQLNNGLTITNGTLDLMALKWDFGNPNRGESGIIRRYANPKDLSSELRAWFDASNAATIFRDKARLRIQRNAGGVVHGWTNLAQPNISAETMDGIPVWSIQKDSIYMINSGFLVQDLQLTSGATVLAVVKTTGMNGHLPAIFTGTFTEKGVPVMLGSYPLPGAHGSTISAARFSNMPGTDWEATDAQRITLDQKQLVGAAFGATDIVLEVDGSIVATQSVSPREFPDPTTYRIGRRWDQHAFWNGYYYELIVSGNPRDLKVLTGYMAWHNNLSSTLPDDHPHKSAPPTVVITAAGSTIK